MSKTKWNGSIITILESVAVCPECGAQIEADVYEISQETDGDMWKVWEDGSGLHIQCTKEDDSHYQMPYVDWMPLEAPVIRWLNDNYDFTPREVTPRTNEKPQAGG
jgi:hypothetical protein